MPKNANSGGSSFISGMSWLGAILTGIYGYSISESWGTTLWYALVGFGIGSLGGIIIRGLLRWIVMTVILVLAIFIFKERIEAIFGIDLDPFIESIFNS